MLKNLKKRNGNRYTIISVIIILAMTYFLYLSRGSGKVDLPEIVYYNNCKYLYSQTIKDASYKYVRKYGASYNGHILLLKRGEASRKIPNRLYIFAGWRNYYEYVLQQ